MDTVPATMEMGNGPQMAGAEGLDTEAAEVLGRSWKWIMAAGVIAIIAGSVAILVPAVASVATAIFIGWILIFSSVVMFASAFGFQHPGQVVARILWAALTLAAGIYLIAAPLHGTVTLTFVLVAYFIVVGLSRLAVGFSQRGNPGAGLIALNGALSLIIGLLILAKLPGSADWAIGLLVGIDLIFAGWALVMTANVGRAQPHAS